MTNEIVQSMHCQLMTNDVLQTMKYWGQGSEWFWGFLQFVAVALTLGIIAWQARIQAMSHVVESICTIQDHWNSETMQRRRNEVCSRWKLKGNKDFDGASEHIANFFEELGVFVKIKALSENIVWDVHSWNIEHYWFMFEPGIKKIREECEENVYCEFENTYKKMREISRKKRWPPVDEQALEEFIKREIRMTKQ